MVQDHATRNVNFKNKYFNLKIYFRSSFQYKSRPVQLLFLIRNISFGVFFLKTSKFQN